jgi:hypothetical protein
MNVIDVPELCKKTGVLNILGLPANFAIANAGSVFVNGDTVDLVTFPELESCCTNVTQEPDYSLVPAGSIVRLTKKTDPNVVVIREVNKKSLSCEELFLRIDGNYNKTWSCDTSSFNVEIIRWGSDNEKSS